MLLKQTRNQQIGRVIPVLVTNALHGLGSWENKRLHGKPNRSGQGLATMGRAGSKTASGACIIRETWDLFSPTRWIRPAVEKSEKRKAVEHDGIQ